MATEARNMSKAWEQWVGATVDGRYPLQLYLSGSDHSAVFLSEIADANPAAVKLIFADAVDAERQLQRWQAACELTHPNLIRILAAGRCELHGTQVLYVVEEYAEENLSQILPERALTAEEARATLTPVLRALEFLHGRSLVHGRVHPANIHAIADQVKLASDTVGPASEKIDGARIASAYDPPEAAAVAGTISAAGDVWQLGMTMVEALTQHLPAWDRTRPGAPEIPAAVPEPFREIAGRCLQFDPGKRWTVAEILSRLETAPLEAKRLVPSTAQSDQVLLVPAMAEPQKAPAKWPYILGLVAAVALAVFFIARPTASNTPPEVQSEVHSEVQSKVQATQPQPGAAAESSQPARSLTQTSPPASGHEGPANSRENDNGVIERVLPKVLPSAQRTIQGTIKVRVKVEVDTAGNVMDARLETAGPSKYFSRLALEAARGWKFSPAPPDESGARTWKLQFAFSRARTEASAVRDKQ
jgi:TonB family protein